MIEKILTVERNSFEKNITGTEDDIRKSLRVEVNFLYQKCYIKKAVLGKTNIFMRKITYRQ